MISERNKPYLAVIIGFLTIPAILPVLALSVKTTATILRCAGGWFCGLQGFYVAPVIVIALSILAMKLLKLAHPYAVALVSGATQIMGWLVYSRVAPTSTVAGVVVMYTFALGSAVIYGVVYALLDKFWKHKSLPVAGWQDEMVANEQPPASSGANLSDASSAGSSKPNYRRILILLGALVVVAIIAYFTVPTLLRQSQRGIGSLQQPQQVSLNTKVDPAKAAKQLLVNMPDKQLYFQFRSGSVEGAQQHGPQDLCPLLLRDNVRSARHGSVLFHRVYGPRTENISDS
jgi:hypothetical protein